MCHAERAGFQRASTLRTFPTYVDSFVPDIETERNLLRLSPTYVDLPNIVRAALTIGLDVSC